jgi:2-polyprenyl-6-methoxyphenol hydroxylase-like FAD-dependent oxidoreductase
MDLSGVRIAIVGGSLGGLAMANVLARAGAAVAVFERARRGFETRGGGLGLDLAAVAALLPGRAPPPHLVLRQRRIWHAGREHQEPGHQPVTSYGALWQWLREALSGTSAEMRFGADVEAIEPADAGLPRQLRLADGTRVSADLVVASDGGPSGLRAAQWGATCRREYAGYVLWRGVVAPADADGDLRERFHIAADDVHHFVAYPIPAHDGALARAAQWLNWGWYFPLSEPEMLALQDAEVVDAPHAIGRLAMPPAWRELLAREANRRWPTWAQHLVDTSAARGLLAPHPVYEYAPRHVVADRLVFAGDAAHLASPVTGSGAKMAIDDALALGAALRAEPDLPQALAAYERSRLAGACAIVAQGHAFGARFRATS